MTTVVNELIQKLMPRPEEARPKVITKNKQMLIMLARTKMTDPHKEAALLFKAALVRALNARGINFYFEDIHLIVIPIS